MDFTYFIFAFFIFILVVATVFISKKIKSPKDKQSEIIADKEKKLFKLYQSLEDMIAGTMEFMEDIKDSVVESKGSVEVMLDRANSILLEVKKESEALTKKEDIEIKDTEDIEDKEEYKKPVLISNKLTRKDQVLVLKKEGQNVKEISKVLGMSQGEVKLIIGLNR